VHGFTHAAERSEVGSTVPFPAPTKADRRMPVCFCCVGKLVSQNPTDVLGSVYGMRSSRVQQNVTAPKSLTTFEKQRRARMETFKSFYPHPKSRSNLPSHLPYKVPTTPNSQDACLLR